MTYHVCDLLECGARSDTPLKISLRGFWPLRAYAGDPAEAFREHAFCSHGCFVKWMQWAIHKENGTTSVLTAVKALDQGDAKWAKIAADTELKVSKHWLDEPPKI